MGQQSNTMAIVSLISGILGFVACGPIGAVVALITGYMAKGQFRENPGLYTGEGMATAGIILGWVNIALTCIGVICYVVIMVMGIGAGALEEMSLLATMLPFA